MAGSELAFTERLNIIDNTPHHRVSFDDMKEAITNLLTGIGESPTREGLVKTPERYIKALQYLTQGYDQSGEDVLNSAIFHENVNDIVLVRDIEIYSMCEHHLLPFWGKALVSYKPKGRIVGLSKMARLCEVYSRRLQVQERLTSQIADTLYNVLCPEWVLVSIEATHMCMMIRGVEQSNAMTMTQAVRGDLSDEKINWLLNRR